ncbi:hypothetical protein RBSH_03734 [Rhodopirellula baltica SH28]|uniref:Uncharacterized protein n=1 Tax=Rhodopirellula baltica SH28 TaxID=993517 RepID=K5CC50_RHOBT|nr:hypothetical protein RBSH_03734 [Rhodopirellula baltica SH28]
MEEGPKSSWPTANINPSRNALNLAVGQMSQWFFRFLGRCPRLR